jgi:oligosaccharide 4-alpha-D-glucosyltransferase
MQKIIQLLFTAFILTISIAVKAQNNNTQLSYKEGTISVTGYAPSIIKIIYQPKNYLTRELVSNAVIAKPLANKSIILSNNPASLQQGNIKTTINNNKIFIEEKTKLQLSIDENNTTPYSFKFLLDATEKIYGGGERALPLNRRGYAFNLYNNPWYGYEEGADNLNYSVPFFMSNKGYALFFDNPSKGYADIGKTNENIFEIGFTSGEINVYVIFGTDYKEILKKYHALTGTQPLPPLWALGNLLSRFGYTSQANINLISSAMKADNIPFDAIIFDLFWFGDSIKNTMGNLDWVNKMKWPNPATMIEGYKKNNIKTILITEPFVVKTSNNFKNALPYFATDSAGKPFILTDFYFGNAGLLDIFRADAKQWFWSKHKPQMNIGVEAWWGDLGEPEKHPEQLYHNLKDKGFNRLFAANEVHNLYGHEWTKMLFEYYQKEYPTKRLFSLNRSGFAGTQRYAIFPWTGDVNRTWSGLRAQLPILLGMSMCGIPYVHADAGGFAGGNGDTELYVRWLQMAAFTPILRPHGTALYDIEPNAFSFPSEAALIEEPFKSYAKQAINLRYSLLPYNYTLAYQQFTQAEPLLKPFFYMHPTDSIACTIEDAYYWGNHIIVAPMLFKNQTKRNIYLPTAHATYYGFNTNFKFNAGPQMAEAGLDKQLLFVPAGSIIPTIILPNGANTAAYKKGLLNWHYYMNNADTTVTYTLYEDDGITNKNIENKKYELIVCSVKEKNNQVTFSLQSKQGSLYNKVTDRPMQLCLFGINKKPNNLLLNNKVLSAKDFSYNENEQKIMIQFKYNNDNINTLQISY